jgi:hypothetical protein
MNMVPGIGGAPQGLEFDAPEMGNASTVEMEISFPLEDGEVEIDLGGAVEAGSEVEFDANLAEHMDEGELQKIASDLMGLVDADIAARKDWVDMYVKGLEVLGMKYEERTEPWDGACGVFSTVLTEAAVRFQSETIIETFPAQGPVKTEIVGAIDRLKEEAAERVRVDMNYQLTEVMPEYRPEHERMLYSLGLAGSAFKKVYFDPGMQRQTAVFIPAEDLIIPYGASSILNAERVTHVMRKTKNDIRKLQAAGFYRDLDLGEPQAIYNDIEKKKAEDQGFSLTSDDRYQIYEVCVDYVVPGFDGGTEDNEDDAIAIPYIITIDRGTQNVLAIRRNWNPDDPAKLKRNHFVQYTYIPGSGAYGLGLIHLIGGYARAGTSLIRQLVDAGTLANLPGGLKARGLRIKGDDTPIQPGEFRDVDVPSGSVRDNIMTLPYKEPSMVLSGLLDKITEEGRRLGSIADMKVSDMSAQAPVGTTLALLERQLKLMSAVQARVHWSMRQEFKLLKAIIREYAPENYTYTPDGGDMRAKQADYDMVEVIPVSDPNSATMAQRIMQYQAAIQLSQQTPQIYDLPHLHRQMLEVLGIKNADKLVPIDDDMKPRDPLSENMAFLNGKPVKAFIYQDHDAHIATHMALKQDPLIMQQIGQNPLAQKMISSIDAHIAEHLAFAYRKKLEDQMGIPMPAPDEDLPQDLEVNLSRLVAQAAQQLLAQSQQKAQQDQAQKMAQDPMVQMQQQELMLKQKDIEIKALKVKGDLQLRAEELGLKAKESAAKTGEDPAMAAALMQQELMQAQELHGMEMAAKAAELQQAQAAQQQKMAHGGQVHAQKMSHAEQQAQMRMQPTNNQEGE